MGKSRLDLYYRISPIIITMPPLSERLEDIPILLDHFLNDLASQYGRPVPEAARDVCEFLMNRTWPGNVRELRHVIERALVYCEDGRLEVKNFCKNPDRMRRTRWDPTKYG